MRNGANAHGIGDRGPTRDRAAGAALLDVAADVLVDGLGRVVRGRCAERGGRAASRVRLGPEPELLRALPAGSLLLVQQNLAASACDRRGGLSRTLLVNRRTSWPRGLRMVSAESVPAQRTRRGRGRPSWLIEADASEAARRRRWAWAVSARVGESHDAENSITLTHIRGHRACIGRRFARISDRLAAAA